MSVPLYPGFNQSIQLEIAKAEQEAALTCTAPNSSSIVNYSINLPHTQINFHTLMKILSGFFCIFVILVALFVIGGHFTHWAVPAEQKQLVRVIAFLPVYAIGAFISIYLYSAQPYVAPIPDYYEGFAISAMFLLFVTFLAPDSSTRSQVFDDMAIQKGSTPSKKGVSNSGAKVFHRTCLFVFQIIPSRIATLVASEVLYTSTCPLSKRRQNGLMVIQVVQAFSTTFAVIAIIRFVSLHNSRLQGRHPRLKLWTFKSVVFLEFLQNVIFSALATKELYRPTQYVSYYDMSIGLNQFIIACECFLYAFMYPKAFEFKPYRRAIKDGQRTRGSPLRAFLEVINPMDIFREALVAFAFVRNAKRSGSNMENEMGATNGTYNHRVNGEARTGRGLGPASLV